MLLLCLPFDLSLHCPALKAANKGIAIIKNNNTISPEFGIPIK